MKDKKLHIRLNWIIVLLALIVGILPVVIMGITVRQISIDFIHQEVANIGREFVEQQFIKISKIHKQMEGVLLILEGNSQITKYFKNESKDGEAGFDDSVTEIQEILSRYSTNEWIDSIDIINNDGEVISSTKNEIQKSISPDEISNYLEQTAGSPKNIIYESIKQVDSNKFPNSTQLSIIKLVSSNVGTSQSELTYGFIVLNLSINKIYDDLNLYHFSDGSQFYVTDSNQRIIFAYSKKLVGTLLPENISSSLGEQTNQQVERNSGVNDHYIHYQLKDSGWNLILTIPSDYIVSKTNEINLSIVGILIITLVFSIACIIVASILLVRPTNQISKAMKEIRQGTFDWNKRLKGSIVSELDGLIHWFNAFIENEGNQQKFKQELHDSESRYRTLFENSPVALWEEDFSQVLEGLNEIGLCDDSLREYLKSHPQEVIELMSKIEIYDLNQSTLLLYGIDNKNELIKNTAKLFQNVSHEALVEELMAMSIKQPDFETSVDNSRADGKIIHVRVRWSVYPGYEEKMSRVIVNTVDITQQIQASNIQAAIYRISQAASATENLQELYKSIHSILGELMPAKNLYIALYDGEKGVINFPYFVDEFDPPPGSRKFGNGWTEYVIRTGQSMLLSPTNLQKLEDDEGVKTVGADSIDWLGVPLKVEDRIIGVVAVQTYTAGVRYTEVELGILEFVSNQIAMAIERKVTEEKLKHWSTHDTLTGLYNRRYYEEEIKRLNSGRQSPVGVIIMDIDGLKQVNDRQGHAAGDELLKAFAHLLQKEFRTSDVVARLGGDEFGVLLPLSPIGIVLKAVERINKSVEKYNSNKNAFEISFSVGYSTTENEVSVIKAINAADALMYKDKAEKKNQK